MVVASWKNFVGLCSFSRIFPKLRYFICSAVPFFRKNGGKDKKWNSVKCNAYWSILISFSSFNERMQMRMPMVMLKERRRNFPLQFCATILLWFSSLLNIIGWWKRRSYFEEKLLILDNNFQFPNNSLSLEKLANMNFVTTSSKRRGNHSEVDWQSIKIIFQWKCLFVAYSLISVSF